MMGGLEISQTSFPARKKRWVFQLDNRLDCRCNNEVVYRRNKSDYRS